MIKARVKSAYELEQFGLSAKDMSALEDVARQYAIGITPAVAATIKHAHDPVGLQYVPQAAELKTTPEEMRDPIGDDEHSPVKGIVHRYPDRVLLKIAQACAVYCRYCFRREMIGPKADALTQDDAAKALEYVRTHKDIWEVILTGGDPLVLSTRQVTAVMDNLDAISHVEVIRIHSRVPVADPARITPELCAALKREKAVYVVVHINHENEITPAVERAFKMLRDADCVLLSQSVLLKGVNDDPQVLENLFRKLVALRVKPYYLHHPDLARGTSHFRLPIKRGQDIMRVLLGRVSGLAQPTYMLDIPGGHGKIPLTPTYLKDDIVEDYQGHRHFYDCHSEHSEESHEILHFVQDDK